MSISKTHDVSIRYRCSTGRVGSTNWLSLPALMVPALIGMGYRIREEERMLQEYLDLPYREYMRRTKRLIPFVL